MKTINRSDVARLARYLAFAVFLYLTSQLVVDMMRHRFRPGEWFDLTPSTLTTVGISLVVVGLIWVNTLNESSEL